MTVQKIGGAMAVALTLVSGAAGATELWDPHLRGVESGLAAGALPPEGVYFALNNYFATFKQYDGSGNKTGLALDAIVEVPILLWNTGLTVFGAQYGVAVAQPFDYTEISVANAPTLTDTGHWGNFNTYLVPVILSWALPHDLHVKASFGVWLDDASSAPGRNPSRGGVGSGNGFTTFEPGLGISWLHDGWNLSAQLYYDTSTKNDRTDYQSGDQIAIDYTATKTIGSWTVGLGAFQLNQLEKDTASGRKVLNSVSQSYGLGPIVGYDFGRFNVQATYNHYLMTNSDVGDNVLNVRLVVPVYQP